EALLSDTGCREADLLAEGARARTPGTRRNGASRRDDVAARQVPARPRPQAAAGSRHPGGACSDRSDGERRLAAAARDPARTAEAAPDRPGVAAARGAGE